jgi:hypothetical protein
MNRLIHHIRSNAISYLALFVALGGTSYAAINLPAGSVGPRQLQNRAVTTSKLANGSVTPSKLDPKAFGGAIVHWAYVREDGRVLGGSRGAHVSVKGPTYYVIGWGDRFPASCSVWTSSPGQTGGVGPFATSIGTQVVQPGNRHGGTTVFVFPHGPDVSTGIRFNIAVLC